MSFDPLLLQGLPYKNKEIDYKKLSLYRSIGVCDILLFLACFILGMFSIPFSSNPFIEYVSIIKIISIHIFALYVIFNIIYIYLWNRVKITYNIKEPLIVCDFKHKDMEDRFLIIFFAICWATCLFVALILSFVNICFLGIVIAIVLRVKPFCLKAIILTQDSLILRYRFYGDYEISLDSLIVVPYNQLSIYHNYKWEDVKSQGLLIVRITRVDKTIYLHQVRYESNAIFGLSNLKELYLALSKRLDIDIIKQTEKPLLSVYKLKER